MCQRKSYQKSNKFLHYYMQKFQLLNVVIIIVDFAKCLGNMFVPVAQSDSALGC